MKANIVNTIPLAVILEEVMGAIYIKDQDKWASAVKIKSIHN